MAVALETLEILKYLADTRAHYATYHNHKEVSAWAGVVLYVAVMVQIVLVKNDALTNRRPVVLLALILILLTAVSVYLKTQFYLRREAANYVAALLYLYVEYLNGKTIRPEDSGRQR